METTAEYAAAGRFNLVVIMFDVITPHALAGISTASCESPSCLSSGHQNSHQLQVIMEHFDQFMQDVVGLAGDDVAQVCRVDFSAGHD